MDLWNQIERLLTIFGDAEAERRRLRMLAERLPSTLRTLPAAKRARAQALGAEALYWAGDAERVVSWSQPVLGPATSLWIGQALFDLGRHAQAARHLRKALDTPDLSRSKRAQVHELVLCCRIATEPETLTVADFQRLHREREALGLDAPLPIALRRILNSRPPRLSDSILGNALAFFARQSVQTAGA